MNTRHGISAALLCVVFVSWAPARQAYPPLTPQGSAQLNRLLANASRAVNQISRWDIQRNDLMDIARAYFNAGEADRTHEIVQGIRKKYEALSEAIASGQNLPEGMRFGMSSVMELSTLALEVAQFGDTADALDIMKQIGYEDRSGQTLQMIAIRQAQAGDVQGAIQTAKRIRGAAWRDSTLGEIVFNDLGSHDVSGALAAETLMAPSAERVHQLVRIEHAQLAAGDRVAATRTVAKARKMALQLPEQPPPGPQNFTVSYRCAPGPNLSPRDQALPYLAQGQWELGDHAAAMATREQVQSAPLREQALYNFIKVDAEANRFAEAEQLAARLPAGACRNEAHATIAGAEVAAGHLTDGIAQASQIPSASAMTWTGLAIKAKDSSAAKSLFFRARAVAASVPNELERAQALYGVAAMESLKPSLHRLYCADSAEAIRLARDARAKGQRQAGLHSMGSISDRAVYEQVISLVDCGKLEQAKVIALTHGGSQRDSEIGSIAAVQATQGDVQGAKKWALSLSSPDDRASALIGVAEGILQQVREQAANSKAAAGGTR